jgi:hypothetical protein
MWSAIPIRTSTEASDAGQDGLPWGNITLTANGLEDPRTGFHAYGSELQAWSRDERSEDHASFRVIDVASNGQVFATLGPGAINLVVGFNLFMEKTELRRTRTASEQLSAARSGSTLYRVGVSGFEPPTSSTPPRSSESAPRSCTETVRAGRSHMSGSRTRSGPGLRISRRSSRGRSARLGRAEIM